MRLRFWVFSGVLCGALVLAGCSREPAGEAETALGAQSLPGPGAEQAEGASLTLQQTVECQTEVIMGDEQRRGNVQSQPIEAIAAKIPTEELIYWGAVGGGTYQMSAIGACEKMITKIVAERSAHVADNPYKVAEISGKIVSEIQDNARADIASDPFGVFNGIMKRRQAASAVYMPGPKGDFEKTADYEARIAREKAEFEKANSGKKITSSDIELVWVGLFGTPYLSTNNLYSQAELYNPDTEMLTVVVRPQVKHQVPVEKTTPGGGVRKELADRYPFEIPVKIKLTPDQAKKFFEEFEIRDLSDMTPVVALQMHNGTLTVKEVSLKYQYPDKWKDLGFTFDHIPVNQELSRNFLTGR